MSSHQFSAQPANQALLPEGKPRTWVQMSFVAPAATGQTRQPLDLALVLDCSGSMGRGPGSKMAHAIEACKFVLGQLQGSDRATVILYGSTVEIMHELSHDHQTAIAKVERAGFLGYTALADGLYSAFEELGAYARERARHVFLLSDGQANVGDTDPTIIADRVRTACTSGIKVSTFGLGADYNENLMEQVATAGAGGYHFLETPDSAPQAFEAELAELFATSARDVRITLKPHNKASVLRLLGLDATKSPIEIGSVPAEAERTVLAEIEIDAKRSQKYTLLEAELSYRDLASDRIITEEQSVVVRLSKDEKLVKAGIDTTVLARVAELQAAEAQQQAAAMADVGNFREARRVLQNSSADLLAVSMQAPAAMSHMLRHKSQELEADINLVRDSASYDKIAAKRIKTRSYLTRSSRGETRNQQQDNPNRTPQP